MRYLFLFDFFNMHQRWFYGFNHSREQKLREKIENNIGGKIYVRNFLKDINASAERHKNEIYGLGFGIRMERL